MKISEIKKLSVAEIGAKQEKLWNCRGEWPDNMNDHKQNPHGRPRNYWCPTVGGRIVAWEGISGWPTKEMALEIAGKFQKKCIDCLAKGKA